MKELNEIEMGVLYILSQKEDSLQNKNLLMKVEQLDFSKGEF